MDEDEKKPKAAKEAGGPEDTGVPEDAGEEKGGKEKKSDQFYDASFSIEAIQNEPYENGFTWRTVLGALFISFVMLPGLIFMGLMVGQDMGTAAEWVTIILFVEISRRAFIKLRKQELYMLKYTAAQLTQLMGGMMLGGGVFAHIVWQRYMRHSEAFESFGIAHQVPDWVSPYGDAAYTSFWQSPWWPVIGVIVLAALLNKITQLSLGYIAFKATADMENLPFPLAPIHAEGAIALAETSQDKNKKGYRQSCFASGVIMGAAFGLIYVAVPVLSQALIGQTIQFLPIPFLDLTQVFEDYMPAAVLGISLNMGLLFVGFVLPWRVVIGTVITSLGFQVVLNPILHNYGFLPSWSPGKDAIQTHISNTVDLYLSITIAAAFAVAAFSFWGVGKAFYKQFAGKNGREGEEDREQQIGEFKLQRLWERDRERGDPPFWAALAVWIGASVCFVLLSHFLINGPYPKEEHFSIWWLVGFAFVFTPLNTYINARMSGIAGQHAGIPMVTEAAIFMSGYQKVNVWFAPLPIHNYGTMADLLKETQLTRTRFTSILKAELLIFPLLLICSFIFWSYITGLGPIPSERYPYVEKFWPQYATMKALWAASMQEGQSLLLQAIKPDVIGVFFLLVVLFFSGFSALGISQQFIYGGIAGIAGIPHNTLIIFAGALLGRFVLSRKFGKEAWTNFAPILAVGFGAGMGLVGMFSIAVNFLWTSIGSGF
jgi:hypothetical protein